MQTIQFKTKPRNWSGYTPKPNNKLKYLNANFVRFHSHGEIENDNSFINCVTIAKNNPNTTYTLWTKRAEIVDRVKAQLKAEDKEFPSNLQLIYSNPVVGVPMSKPPRNFHGVFNVFPKGVDKTKNNINCEGKCIECRVCYSDKLHDVKVINEIQKGKEMQVGDIVCGGCYSDKHINQYRKTITKPFNNNSYWLHDGVRTIEELNEHVHTTIGQGKMTQINSINTNTTTNPYCIKMMQTARKKAIKIAHERGIA